MGVLDRFERRLEGLVSGAFARAFKSEVQPIEIAGALQRECDDRAAIVSRGRTMVPNDFVVELGPHDHERLAPYADALAFEFAGVVQEYAAEQHYQFVGPVEVHLERAEDLDTGMFRVKSRVVPGVMPMSEPAPVRQPAAWLEINGQPHGLTKPVVVIGRGSDVDLRIDDPGISRRHAEIRAGFTTTVTDLGSTNGTLLNGELVSQAQLEDGDQIMLGNTILIYRRETG
ncbi:MAG TPA: DUF3662 and FHA domain-containing protein [Actinomycetes bacterium]|nr:DUF3662 and FHA domain-containing protein [Actinomycetes bacterium]